MNGYTDREVSSRASREAFFAHLHEYLVQSGCMQTANALTKEASLRLPGDVQDSFFYDWWCSLLNSHNFAGLQPQAPPGMVANPWDNGAAMAPVAGANSAASGQNLATKQPFKVPTNGRVNSAQAAAAPVAVPAPKPTVKGKARSRKSSASKAANKGSPILVPGVAPLVVPRSASAAANGQLPGTSARAGAGPGQNPQNRGGSEQPNTPRWDNNPHMGEAYQRENPQRSLQAQGVNQMPQIAETPGMLAENAAQMPQNTKTPQNQSKNEPENAAAGAPDSQQLQQQQQFHQQQQFLHQQQFFQLQQQQNQQNHQHQGPVPPGVVGGNPAMVSARGGPASAMGPGSMVNENMMVHKQEPMNEMMGNPNVANFLDDMMGTNVYVNGGLNFPTEPSLDGLGFDSVASRPMPNGQEFAGNGGMYTENEPGQFKEQEFDDKDHAGMTNGAISSDNFMNANFGFGMNPSMSLDNSENMGPNFGYGGESGGNGEFFLEAPLTMSL